MVAHPCLHLRGAVVRRSGRVALGPLDLSLTLSGITALLGPNGAGKTTLLRLLHEMEPLAEGRIRWSADPGFVRTQRAFVLQRPVMMRRSVRENLAYPLRLAGRRGAAARAAVDAALAGAGLSDRAGDCAHGLSGGERQKLALARALVLAPRLLLLDEPCAGIDGATMREIEATLRDNRARGVVCVLATHDLAQARRLADHVVFLCKGRLVDHGAADAFFADPRTPEATAFVNADPLP